MSGFSVFGLLVLYLWLWCCLPCVRCFALFGCTVLPCVRLVRSGRDELISRLYYVLSLSGRFLFGRFVESKRRGTPLSALPMRSDPYSYVDSEAPPLGLRRRSGACVARGCSRPPCRACSSPASSSRSSSPSAPARRPQQLRTWRVQPNVEAVDASALRRAACRRPADAPADAPANALATLLRGELTHRDRRRYSL